MRLLAFFLVVLTLSAGCVLEDKPVIPEDGGVEAGPCGICEFETPVCNDGLQCVECTADLDDFCTEMALVCKTGAFVCVACNANSDCNDAAAARCDTMQNECAGCQGAADCIGIEGRPVCDDRTCVQCTPGTEDVDCGGKSCDPLTRECTETTVGSRETCEECVADSECGEDGSASEAHRCVEMFYPVGERFPNDATGFCLKTTQGGCEQPYSITLSMRPSLSGPPLNNYCGINEQLAACPAVRALVRNQTCLSGNTDECPQPTGLCQQVGDLQTRCTYPCASLVECLENDPDGRPGSTCGSSGSGSGKYCGG
jgi:hypothetical protein